VALQALHWIAEDVISSSNGDTSSGTGASIESKKEHRLSVKYRSGSTNGNNEHLMSTSFGRELDTLLKGCVVAGPIMRTFPATRAF
jgi:hypothetical protein